MNISPATDKYFTFSLSEEEHKDPSAHAFFDKFKRVIPHGGRYWFPEEKQWKIHVDYFGDFLRLLNEYIQKIVFKQGSLF